MYAARGVLAAASPVFRALLRGGMLEASDEVRCDFSFYKRALKRAGTVLSFVLYRTSLVIADERSKQEEKKIK